MYLLLWNEFEFATRSNARTYEINKRFSMEKELNWC